MNTWDVSLLIEGHHSGGGPEGGASAVPAGGLAHRSRAAPGITHAGTTTGAGGAVPGLGQAKAGNSRWSHVPGSMAWSWASCAYGPLARAAVERRKASGPR